MSEFAENSQEHDVDAIIAQAYGHEQPQQQSAPAPQQAPEPQAPSYKEYEFNARGQAVKIREDDPRFQQWLSQGYDYAQNMTSIKRDREQWEQDRQSWEKNWGRYKAVDEFAQQNPDWWEQVEQSYQHKQSPVADIPPQLKSYLEPIIKDYGMVKELAQRIQREDIEKQTKEQDAALEQEIKSIQGKYQNLDFSSKDESGLTLEQRVLNHAIENGLPNFKTAFLDYYHDNLEKLAEARGKEAVMQEMQKKKQLGLLGESPTPTKGVFQAHGVKGKSWSDIHSEALRELNLI